MTPPLVSVVIATWNTAAFLPETLASALAQTWERTELIVVDDGSTDETPQAVAPFLSRIRYERRPHGGLAAARNEGIRLAGGDYIALLDADDLWLPEKIAVQVALAQQRPSSGLIVCNGEEFSDDGVLDPSLLPTSLFKAPASEAAAPPRYLEITGDFQRQLIKGTAWISCPAQVLIPRPVVDQIGPFAPSGAQDYDYYLRVSRRYPVTFHLQVLARWRYHPGAMSGSRSERPVRWGLYTLPVLHAHRARCRPEDREALEARIREYVRFVGDKLMSQRRLEETVTHFQTELELDPQSPARAYSSACMGWALFFLRRPEEAIPLLQAAWKLPPGNPAPLTLLTAAYAHLGRMEEAAQALEALPSGWPFADWVNSASTDDDREYFRAGLALAGVEV